MPSTDRWIDDLGEYYSHNKAVPQIRTDMLMNVYGRRSSAILARAAHLYMMENEHFPSVANFKPYVEMAGHQETAKTIRRVHRHTDDEMYDWELARGTMRPLVDIDAEIAEARLQLKEMT